MPDARGHRGAHPQDSDAFREGIHSVLRVATTELSWLQSRGYATPAALVLVGNHHQLLERQRIAVRRAACSDGALERRRRMRVEPTELAGRDVAIDGFNLLTTVEAALAGGVLLRCRDGLLRDMASMHGTWRRVAETEPALTLVAQAIAAQRPASVRWLLDRPVSNSGRLRALILAAAPKELSWTVEVVRDPDPILADTDAVIVTADSGILDRAGPFCDLASWVVATLHVAEVDLQ